MQKGYLLVDFIKPSGTFAMTTNVEKVNWNVARIPGMADGIAEKRKNSTSEAMSVTTVVGRWIVMFQGNISNDDETMLYIVDFRLDLNDFEGNIFSSKGIKTMQQLQERYDQVFKPSMDTIELSFAEVYENIVKSNFFVCGQDDIVLKKADELGVLPTIKVSDSDNRVRVTLSDDWEDKDEQKLLHLYAFIRFSIIEETSGQYGYIKVYDVKNNQHLLDDFLDAIHKAGGEFERGYLLERFTKAKLN